MSTLKLSLSCLALTSALVALPALAADIISEGGNSAVDQNVMTIADQPGGTAGGEHRWHHEGGMMSLTDDQLASIAKIRGAAEDQTGVQFAKLHALKRQLHQTLMEPTIDKAKAMGLQDSISALRADIARTKLSARIDIAGVFTAEQRQHMRHMMLMHDAFGGRGHHHHGGGGKGECGHGGPGGHEGHHGWHGGHGGHGGPGGPGGPGASSGPASAGDT